MTAFFLLRQYTTSNNILLVVISGFIFFNGPIRDQLIKSLGNKTNYIARAVLWLVSICYCLAYDWTVTDELKITW